MPRSIHGYSDTRNGLPEGFVFPPAAVPPERVRTAIRQALRDKRGADRVHELAFAMGREAVASA